MRYRDTITESEALSAEWRRFSSRSVALAVASPCLVAELDLRPIASDLDPKLQAQLGPEEMRAYQRIRSQARRMEWSEARRALRSMGSFGLPGTLTSVSHADGHVLAIALRSEGQSPIGALGIGVDWEPVTREVSEKIADRITRPEERSVADSMTRLELWVAKEAAFKSDPQNAGRVLHDYVISRFDLDSGEGTMIQAETGRAIFFRVLYLSAGDRNWTISFAICLK